MTVSPLQNQYIEKKSEMYWHNLKYVTVTETKLLQHFFSLILKGPKAEADFTSPKEEVLNYFDKIHPVVSTMTRSPSLIA